MPKKSTSALHGEARNHKRSKSGTTTPTASPKSAVESNLKRNSSHVVLPKNRSHGNLNLRKNKSTNTLVGLNRNLSRGALNKLGAAPSQKAKKEEEHQKQGVFDLGDNSDDEDEEDAAWEDSTASPELTRNNSKNTSKVSTPVRAPSPNGETIQKPPQVQPLVPERTSSPPEPSVLKPNTSAPNLQYQRLPERPKADPPMLQQNGRGSRAPPAMSTANAHPTLGQVGRIDSQRALNDVKSSRTSVESSAESKLTPQTPNTPAVGQSSSGSASVSHFLPDDPSLPRRNTGASGAISSDDESVSDFMNTYKPQPSESPDKPRTTSYINKARLSAVPSRTQQKLELQRREVMRGTPGTAVAGGMGISAGSGASIHGRSASKGRNAARGSMAGEYNVDKLIKQDYETAVKQLTVVRRFRNPILESLGRIRENRALPLKESGQAGPKRPPSRHGRASTGAAIVNGNAKGQNASPPESGRHLAQNGHAGPRASTGRVQFQLSRDVSTEDMGVLTTSQGSPEVSNIHDENEGLSMEEALIRRMWESRVHEQVA